MKSHKGTVVTDEIAIDFSEIGIPYERDLSLCSWITQEQFSLVQDIEEKLSLLFSAPEYMASARYFISSVWSTAV